MARYDVLVVGAGAAGVAAAVGAARSGASVLLVERLSTPGGLATSAEVGTICGLHRRGELRWAGGGFVREVGQRVVAETGQAPLRWTHGLVFLPCPPPAFAAVCDALLASEPGLELRLGATLTALRPGWEAELLRADRREQVHATCVVDASGVAWAAAAAGAGLLPDEERQSPALVFTVAGLPDVEPFALRTFLNKEVARGLAEGTAPACAGHISIVPGSEHAGTARLKLGLAETTAGEPADLDRLERLARRDATGIVRWLRGLPGLQRLALVAAAPALGVRTGRRARGEVVVDGEHVLQAATCPDGVAWGAWPVERWMGGRQPELRLLAEGAACEVPARALIAQGVSRLFLAGRVLSATEEAAASLRVIGTCFGTGYAAGCLAAAEALGRPRSEAIVRLRAEMEDREP